MSVPNGPDLPDLLLMPGEGKRLVVSPGGTEIVFKARGERPAAAFAFMEWMIEPNWPGPVPHVHRRHEELVYVLDGELTFLVGDEVVIARPRTFLRLPPGLKHAFSNHPDGSSHLIMVVSPPDFEGYFDSAADLAARVRRGEITDRAQVLAIQRQIRARFETDEV